MTRPPRITCRDARRRGSVYVLVLGVAMLVTVVGLSALTVARMSVWRGAQGNDAAEASALAESAVEYALSVLAADANWRTRYANGVETAPVPLGHGTIGFKLVDEALGLPGGDGDLANNNFDPVRVYGIGRTRNAARVYSVRLKCAVPLDVMRTTIGASGAFTDEGGTLISSGGPISTNGDLNKKGTIVGGAEALSVRGGGTITGTLVCPAPAKAMPDRAVFDMYRRLATEIPFGSFGGGNGTFAAPLLSAAVNPTGGATNANGVYYIQVPAGKKLLMQINRIKGTLLVDCADKAAVQQVLPVCWEPNSPDLPILLIRHTTNSPTDDWVKAAPGTIVEAAVGANLNPPGTPYNGVSNSTLTDVYPSRLKGLIHVMSPPSNPGGSQTTIDTGVSIYGTLIADMDVWVKDASVALDPTLSADPPIGYATGPTMAPVAGTWRWETSP